MIVYLDGAQNRKGAPNENFAREVMELFTLGEGHYTEQDVKEAARAFTGWSIDRRNASFIYRWPQHDAGVKTIFGRSAAYDGDDVLDLLLARPETAELVTAKLWREFVSPQPDAGEVSAIAKRFRDSHYEIKVALHDLLVVGCVLCAAEPRGAGEVAGGARGRHAARARPRAGRHRAVRRRDGRHGPEPLLAAEREGLAGRRSVDQHDHAARTQAIPRPPRARGRNAGGDGVRGPHVACGWRRRTRRRPRPCPAPLRVPPATRTATRCARNASRVGSSRDCAACISMRCSGRRRFPAARAPNATSLRSICCSPPRRSARSTRRSRRRHSCARRCSIRRISSSEALRRHS